MGLMDKAGEFLNSEQGEQVSDQGLQAGADALNTATGGQHADKIAQGQQMADDRIGMPNAQQQTPSTGDEGQVPDPNQGA